MKIGGVTVSRNEQVLVLPRIDGDLIIKAAAVLSLEEFETICPKPIPPVRITKNGKETHESSEFIKEIGLWGQKRYAYICIKSLEPSNVEWDKVDDKKPNTWTGWTDEMKAAGLTDVEVGRISNLILEANSLNEAKLEEARKLFLAGLEAGA